ncbi:MAG: ImmA/IrrE family metallo-endopeptidase [Acidobacteria bacterium]|nr:ImmA/IrrE family metallo-endopeptidase [Acidobacteriota bacterium]
MKHFSLSRIREVFPEFNKRPITENDFWRACKRFRIIVKQLPLSVDGYCERRRGRYYILINSRLTGYKWLHTALHEFCHFLFDAPDQNENYVFYRRPYDRDSIRDGMKRTVEARERFADAFALIAMLPMPELERLAHEDLTENHELLRLCQERIKVRADYGL